MQPLPIKNLKKIDFLIKTKIDLKSGPYSNQTTETNFSFKPKSKIIKHDNYSSRAKKTAKNSNTSTDQAIINLSFT